MLFAAKCYWPGVTLAELRSTGAAAERRGDAFVGSLFFPDDDIVLCFFEASSAVEARRAAEHCRMPCDRVMESRWLVAHQPERSHGCGR